MNRALQVSQGFFPTTKAQTTLPIPGWLRAESEAARWSMPDASKAEGQSRVYQKLTWISASIDIPAQAAAGTEFSVKEKQGEDTTDIPNHDFELRLDKPNPHQSRFEFIRDFFSYFRLTGNGYIWLNRSSENMPPAEMWIIPSHMIKPVPDGNMFIKGYLFNAGGGSGIPLETWEVSHMRTFNPFSRYVGLSMIESLALTVNADLAEQMFNANLFAKDNAKLPGALAFADNIPDPEWEKMKLDAQDNWGGMKRAGPMMLRGVGAGGVEWLTMAANQKEMEFLETRQFNKEEIFIKTPGLLQILDKNVTEANALAGKAVFSEYTLYPMLCQAGQKWTNDILPAYGENIVGEFDDVRKSDRLLDLKEQEYYMQVHTVDEVRSEYYGDDPIEGGNLPVDSWTGSKPTPKPEPATPTQPEPTTTENAIAEAMATPDVVKAELRQWENFALKRLGKSGREFEPRAIPLIQAAQIKTELKAAKTASDVRRIFEGESEQELLRIAVSELARFNAIAEKSSNSV